MATIEDILGMDPHEFIYETSQAIDPIQEFDEFMEDLDAERPGLSEHFSDELAEIRESIQSRQDTFAEQAMHRDSTREYEPEVYQPYTKLWDDVNGKNEIYEYINSQESRSSREIRNRIDNERINKMTPQQRQKQYHKRIMLEHGTFDINVTRSTHAAWLQVRRDLYHNTLKVGMILINMSNGHAQCKVYGCKHEFQLSSRSASPETITDREWQEYQVLRIFEHLGTHNNPAWPKFTSHTNPNHDTTQEKLASRSSVLALRSGAAVASASQTAVCVQQQPA